MIDGLRAWLLGVIGASIISAMALCLTPKGRIREVTKLVCGIVIVIAMIRPVVEMDFAAYSANIVKYKEEVYELDASLEEENQRLNRIIIEEETAAYILDKAQVLGLTSVTVRVTAKWGDEGYWYPSETYIVAQGDEATTRELSAIIEADLGVPKEKQTWARMSGPE